MKEVIERIKSIQNNAKSLSWYCDNQSHDGKYLILVHHREWRKAHFFYLGEDLTIDLKADFEDRKFACESVNEVVKIIVELLKEWFPVTKKRRCEF